MAQHIHVDTIAQAWEQADKLFPTDYMKDEQGSLRGGRTIWLLGKMPDRYIAGDKFEPYICFTNTHDGTGAVRACMTPVRVVCNNTLNMALSEAQRKWSTIHRGNISMKLEEARQTLELADVYLKRLDEEADRLANEKMTEGQLMETLEKMFPVDEDASERAKRTAEKSKEEIIICTMRPDLAAFLGTKWGFLNAVSDYVGHSEPARRTKNYDENRWGNIIGGHWLLDKAMELVAA